MREFIKTLNSKSVIDILNIIGINACPSETLKLIYQIHVFDKRINEDVISIIEALVEHPHITLNLMRTILVDITSAKTERFDACYESSNRVMIKMAMSSLVDDEILSIVKANIKDSYDERLINYIIYVNKANKSISGMNSPALTNHILYARHIYIFETFIKEGVSAKQLEESYGYKLTPQQRPLPQQTIGFPNPVYPQYQPQTYSPFSQIYDPDRHIVPEYDDADDNGLGCLDNCGICDHGCDD